MLDITRQHFYKKPLRPLFKKMQQNCLNCKKNIFQKVSSYIHLMTNV